MVTRDQVERLCQREPAPDHPVLSVFLDVDQSRTANRNREFVAALRARLRDLELQVAKAEQDRFRAARQRVEAYLGGYEPHGKTLMLHAGGSSELWWSETLAATVPSDARWAPVPYVRPLVEALVRHRRHAVVVVSKERARLASVHLDEIEDERDAIAAADVHHKKASGTDHLRSQMSFQRQDDMHASSHLRYVAELLDDMDRERPVDWVVLGGPPETTSELAGFLSQRLADRLAGAIRVSFTAPAADVLAAASAVVEGAEQRADEARVDQVIDGGVYGLEATLQALHERRVQRLVYGERFAAPGAECLRCRGLFSPEVGPSCPYDRQPLLAHDDIVDRAVARATTLAAAVQPVRGDAAARLVGSGGIGVVPRF